MTDRGPARHESPLDSNQPGDTYNTDHEGPAYHQNISSVNQKLPGAATNIGKSVYLPPPKARANLKKFASNNPSQSLNDSSASSQAKKAMVRIASYTPEIKDTKLGASRSKPAKIRYSLAELLIFAKAASIPSGTKHMEQLLRRAAIRNFIHSNYPDLASERPQKQTNNPAAASSVPPSVHRQPNFSVLHTNPCLKETAQQSNRETDSQASQNQPNSSADKSGPTFLQPIIIPPNQQTFELVGMLTGTLPFCTGLPGLPYPPPYPQKHPFSPPLPATTQANAGTLHGGDGFWKASDPFQEEPPLPMSPSLGCYQTGLSGQGYAIAE